MALLKKKPKAEKKAETKTVVHLTNAPTEARNRKKAFVK